MRPTSIPIAQGMKLRLTEGAERAWLHGVRAEAKVYSLTLLEASSLASA